MKPFPLLLLAALGLLVPDFTSAHSRNVFAGPGTGASNTTGSSKSFLGYGAGYSNTAGIRNSFIGINTGIYNTIGAETAFWERRREQEIRVAVPTASADSFQQVNMNSITP